MLHQEAVPAVMEGIAANLINKIHLLLKVIMVLVQENIAWTNRYRCVIQIL